MKECLLNWHDSVTCNPTYRLLTEFIPSKHKVKLKWKYTTEPRFPPWLCSGWSVICICLSNPSAASGRVPLSNELFALLSSNMPLLKLLNVWKKVNYIKIKYVKLKQGEVYCSCKTGYYVSAIDVFSLGSLASSHSRAAMQTCTLWL